MSRTSHIRPVVQHFTPRRVLGAVREHPMLLFELPWMARAAADWGVRAVTEEFSNRDDLKAFLADPKTQSVDTIIFAIHGYFADKGHFAPVHQRVFEQEYGFGFFAPQYGTFRDIHLSARYLGTHVKNILREADAHIALYGHSLGALVALELFYDRLSVAEQARVSHVLLVAGPHHGTPKARHGYGFSAHQMCAESEYIRSWQERYPTLPYGEKIISFSAPSDSIVPKQSTQIQIPEAQQYVLDDVGASPLTSHVSLLYSKRVARALAEFIGKK